MALPFGIPTTRIPAAGINTGIVHLYVGCRNEVDFLHKSQLETLELQWGGHSWVSKLVNPQNGMVQYKAATKLRWSVTFRKLFWNSLLSQNCGLKSRCFYAI